MLTSLFIASALYSDNLHSANMAQRMMSDAAVTSVIVEIGRVC